MTRRSLNKANASQSSNETVHVPRTFVDDWSIKEKLLLASLAIEHKESWLAVRSSMRSFLEAERTTDILHNQCAAQYEKLKEDEPEVAQSLRGRSKRHSQSAEPTIYRLEIYRRMADRRVEELKKNLPVKRDKMLSIKSDLDLWKSGKATPEDKARIEERVAQMKREAEEGRQKGASLGTDSTKDDTKDDSKLAKVDNKKEAKEASTDKGDTSTKTSDATPTRATTRRESSRQQSESNKQKVKSDLDPLKSGKATPEDKAKIEERVAQTKRETEEGRQKGAALSTDSTKDDTKDDSRLAKVDNKKEAKEASTDKGDTSTKTSDATPTRATTRRESSRQQSESNKQKVKRIMAMIFRDTKQHENIKLLDRPTSQSDSDNYNSVILKPIDLAQVKKRMDTDLDNPIELQNDLLLMFQNACMFYPENHPIHQAAVKMRADLSPKWELAMNEFVPPRSQGKDPTSSQSKVRPRERRHGSMKSNTSFGKTVNSD